MIKDYGCDPLPNNMYKLVPSGKIVSYEEMLKILPVKNNFYRDRSNVIISDMTFGDIVKKQQKQ